MGIYADTFRCDDAGTFVRLLHSRLEERLGKPVDLEMKPPGYRVLIGSLNVLILEEAAERHVFFQGSWLTRRVLGGTRRVREAFTSLGGSEVPARDHLSYRFIGAPPLAQDVVRAVGGARLERFGATAVLSLVGGSIEVHLAEDSVGIEASLAVSPTLYQAVIAEAKQLLLK